MKVLIRKTLFFATILMVAATGALAQRVIQGTVYKDGEPAAGITVEAHKGSSMMTSFDGKYKVDADEKTKWIKFTYIDETKKLDIDDDPVNQIDFAFTGKLPSGGSDDDEGADVILKSAEELLSEQDREFMNQLSLYTEFYKQGDYMSSLPYWRKIYTTYPRSTSNIYIHGAKIYEYLIENAKTDAERDKYLAEYMKLHDKRVKHFGQEGFVLGRKATAWLEYKLDENRTSLLEGDDLKEVLKVGYEWLEKSVDLQGPEAELPTVLLLMQTTRSLFKLGELSKETVVKNYEKSNKLLNQVISKNEDAYRVANAKEIQPYIENLFGTSGAADCETLVNIFTPQFQEKFDDVEYIKSMLRRLRKAKCDNSELVEKATIRLYELEPSAEAAFNMARRYLKKDNMDKAKEYYQQAISQETDPMLLASYHYERGLLRYAKLNDLSGAREEARKALALDSDMCEANLLIGDIYVASTRNFNGDDFEKAAIFWLAVDYYTKARRSDNCAVDASEKISTYRRYFPNKEEAFMRSVSQGDSYKIGGWINESTKVRF